MVTMTMASPPWFEYSSRIQQRGRFITGAQFAPAFGSFGPKWAFCQEIYPPSNRLHLQCIYNFSCPDKTDVLTFSLVHLCTCETCALVKHGGASLTSLGGVCQDKRRWRNKQNCHKFLPRIPRFIACVKQTENKQISFCNVLKTHILSSEGRDDVETKNCCTFFGSLCVAGLTRVLSLFEGWTFRRADNRKSSIIQTPSPVIWFGARVHTLAFICLLF